MESIVDFSHLVIRDCSNVALHRVIIIKVKVSKRHKKRTTDQITSNLNGILLKTGENVWLKEKLWMMDFFYAVFGLRTIIKTDISHPL